MKIGPVTRDVQFSQVTSHNVLHSCTLLMLQKCCTGLCRFWLHQSCCKPQERFPAEVLAWSALAVSGLPDSVDRGGSNSADLRQCAVVKRRPICAALELLLVLTAAAL